VSSCDFDVKCLPEYVIGFRLGLMRDATSGEIRFGPILIRSSVDLIENIQNGG
jgi:hypothetical protein